MYQSKTTMNPNQGTESPDGKAHSLIEFTSRWLQSDINRDKVQRLVSAEMKNRGDVLPDNIKIHQQSPELVAAYAIIISKETESGEFDFGSFRSDIHMNTIDTGAEILEMYNDYWRFEPCIESILEMDSDQSEMISSYLDSFSSSDYSLALEHKRQSCYHLLSEWDPMSTNSENIQLAIDMYEDMLTIFERGFPNLLAMKRILDGEQPNNDDLQNIRASSVRRELLDTETHQNSVYFDLIVEKFDSKLRNGISHGDLVNDPVEKSIRIPTQNTQYSYSEVNEIMEANISNAIFLTGMFQSLVKWQYATIDLNDVNRDLLPI